MSGKKLPPNWVALKPWPTRAKRRVFVSYCAHCHYNKLFCLCKNSTIVNSNDKIGQKEINHGKNMES
jgi:DTW domain-containing protein YfiP